MLTDKTRHTTPYYIYSLSQYSELIQEYQEDKDWTHKLDQEKVDIENLSFRVPQLVNSSCTTSSAHTIPRTDR